MQNQFFYAIDSGTWDRIPIILNSLRESLMSKTDYVSGRMIIETEIIPNVLELLHGSFSTHTKLQVEAAALIAQISAGPIEDKFFLIEQGCIQALAQCLLLNNEEVHENAMWGLANIAIEEDLRYRDAILELGTLREVVRQLRIPPKRNTYTRTAMWLISSLLRGYPFPPFNETSVALTVITQLIHHSDLMTQHYTLVSLAYLTEKRNEAELREIAGQGFISKLVKLMASQEEKISPYALHIAGNLATGDIDIKQQLVMNRIFYTLPKFINCSAKEIRKEACYILRNILTEGFRDHDHMVNELMPLIIQRVNDENYEQVRQEAALCVINFVSNCSQQEAQFLVSQGVIDALLVNMREDLDPSIVLNALIALSTILGHGEQLKGTFRGTNPYVMRIMQSSAGGLIDSLRHHKDENVCRQVRGMIEAYFSVPERIEECK